MLNTRRNKINRNQDKKMSKNLILTAHKHNYYTAAALLYKCLGDADTEFTSADTLHEDLLKYKETHHKNIYIIGVRLKADYEKQLKDALTALGESKKEVRFYLITDRIEIPAPGVSYFMPFIREARELTEGSMLPDIIRKDFNISDSDFSGIKDIYLHFVVKNHKDSFDNTKRIAKFIDYEYNMHFKWEVGDTSNLSDMIIKVATDTISAEEYKISWQYESNEYMLTGNSRVIREIREKAYVVGSYDIPVLIYGETGTGKEYLARMLADSGRRAKNFVAVNCAAISPNLMESTLFGHKKGAFTGAYEDNPGIIAKAEGGTLFLDEITEMPLDIQSKLLRFLQDFEYYPLGYVGKGIKADVRVIAATNADIKKMIKEKKFREDLYYRLSGVELRLPPLRERKEDIKTLAVTIVYKLKEQFNIQDFKIGPKEYKILESYDWPGNIRQLHKFLSRCVIFNATGENMQKMLEEETRGGNETAVSHIEFADESKIITVCQAEEFVIRKALKLMNYNKKKAAVAVGLSLNTFKDKMKKYGITDNPAAKQ